VKHKDSCQIPLDTEQHGFNYDPILIHIVGNIVSDFEVPDTILTLWYGSISDPIFCRYGRNCRYWY